MKASDFLAGARDALEVRGTLPKNKQVLVELMRSQLLELEVLRACSVVTTNITILRGQPTEDSQNSSWMSIFKENIIGFMEKEKSSAWKKTMLTYLEEAIPDNLNPDLKNWIQNEINKARVCL